MLLFTVVKTGEHAVPATSASAEVNQFDYICTLLQRKNFSLSETVSMVDLYELERMKPKSSLAVRRVASPCEDPVFGNVNDDLASFLKKPKSTSISDLSSGFIDYIGVLPRTLSVPTELDSFGELAQNCNDEVIEIDEKNYCIPPVTRRSKSCGYLNMVHSPVQLNGDLAVSSLSASREVNQFDYICSLLQKKNFSLSETISMVDLYELERMKPKSSLAVRRVASPCEDPMFGDVDVDGDLVSFLNKPRSKSMSELSSASTANSSALPKTLSVPTELHSFGELCNDEVIDSDEKEYCIPSLKPSRSCGDLAMVPTTSIKSDLSLGGVNEKDEAVWFEYLSDLLVRKKFDPLSETVSMMDFEELLHRKPKSNLDCRSVQTLKSKVTTSQLAILASVHPQPTAAVDGSQKKTPKFQTLKRSWRNLRTNVRKLFCWSR